MVHKARGHPEVGWKAAFNANVDSILHLFEEEVYRILDSRKLCDDVPELMRRIRAHVGPYINQYGYGIVGKYTADGGVKLRLNSTGFFEVPSGQEPFCGSRSLLIDDLQTLLTQGKLTDYSFCVLPKHSVKTRSAPWKFVLGFLCGTDIDLQNTEFRKPMADALQENASNRDITQLMGFIQHELTPTFTERCQVSNPNMLREDLVDVVLHITPTSDDHRAVYHLLYGRYLQVLLNAYMFGLYGAAAESGYKGCMPASVSLCGVVDTAAFAGPVKTADIKSVLVPYLDEMTRFVGGIEPLLLATAPAHPFLPIVTPQQAASPVTNGANTSHDHVVGKLSQVEMVELAEKLLEVMGTLTASRQ